MTAKKARWAEARRLRQQLRAVGVRVDLPTSIRLATVARRSSTADMLELIPGWRWGWCSWSCSDHPNDSWAADFPGGTLEVDCTGGIKVRPLGPVQRDPWMVRAPEPASAPAVTLPPVPTVGTSPCGYPIYEIGGQQVCSCGMC